MDRLLTAIAGLATSFAGTTHCFSWRVGETFTRCRSTHHHRNCSSLGLREMVTYSLTKTIVIVTITIINLHHHHRIHHHLSHNADFHIAAPYTSTDTMLSTTTETANTTTTYYNNKYFLQLLLLLLLQLLVLQRLRTVPTNTTNCDHNHDHHQGVVSVPAPAGQYDDFRQIEFTFLPPADANGRWLLFHAS